MSDETKITEVDVTPKGYATAAAMAALKPGTDIRDRRTWADAISAAVVAAIEAYEKAQGCVVERVIALRPEPGDIVLFSLRENATMEQIEEMAQVLSATLPQAFDQVQFMGSRAFEGVKIVRPAPETEQAVQHSPRDCARLGCPPETEGHRG